MCVYNWLPHYRMAVSCAGCSIYMRAQELSILSQKSTGIYRHERGRRISGPPGIYRTQCIEARAKWLLCNSYFPAIGYRLSTFRERDGGFRGPQPMRHGGFVARHRDVLLYVRWRNNRPPMWRNVSLAITLARPSSRDTQRRRRRLACRTRVYAHSYTLYYLLRGNNDV